MMGSSYDVALLAVSVNDLFICFANQPPYSIIAIMIVIFGEVRK